MHPTSKVAAIVVGVGAILVNLLQACSFSGVPENQPLKTPEEVYELINTAPFTEPSESERWTVLEEAGRLKVEHGRSCAAVARALGEYADGKDYVGTGILEIAELNDGYAGTVFLNGWKLEYESSDHNVVGLGSTIFNIYQVGNQLLWNAGGVLSDKNGDDAYKWCYAYTLVSWPKDSTSVDIDVVHSDPSAALMFVDAEQGSSAGVVHTIPGTFRSKGKRPRLRKPPRAPLLAGFGMVWTSGDDQDVLQVAFDRGSFSIQGRRMNWISDIILKDNAADRTYRSAEIVSVLKGNSVRVSHPPTVLLEGANGVYTEKSNDFDLSPRSTSSCPNVGGPGGRVYHFAVPNLHHRWAVPMLTGWDIGDVCNDSNVKGIGAWIEDFDYVAPSGQQAGTLYYTVRTNFFDKDGYPGMRDQVKIDVLGFDLVRRSPIDLPTTPIEF